MEENLIMNSNNCQMCWLYRNGCPGFEEQYYQEPDSYWRYDDYFDMRSAPRKNFTTKEAEEIAEQLNVTFEKFEIEDFRIGLNVELEHGSVNLYTNITNDDPILTGKITLAHLNEFPDYYKRLTKMEEEAERYWAREERQRVNKK